MSTTILKQFDQKKKTSLKIFHQKTTKKNQGLCDKIWNLTSGEYSVYRKESKIYRIIEPVTKKKKNKNNKQKKKKKQPQPHDA